MPLGGHAAVVKSVLSIARPLLQRPRENGRLVDGAGARCSQKLTGEQADVKEVDGAVTIQVGVKFAALKYVIFQERKIEKIDHVVVVKIGVAEVAKAVTIAIALVGIGA